MTWVMPMTRVSKRDGETTGSLCMAGIIIALYMALNG